MLDFSNLEELELLVLNSNQTEKKTDIPICQDKKTEDIQESDFSELFTYDNTGIFCLEEYEKEESSKPHHVENDFFDVKTKIEPKKTETQAIAIPIVYNYRKKLLSQSEPATYQVESYLVGSPDLKYGYHSYKSNKL